MINILKHLRSMQKSFKFRIKKQKERSISTGSCDQTVTKQTILVEKDENITLIGISRERDRNCFDLITLNQLKDAINSFESDVTSPVGVLHGESGSFSAGYDVIELKEQIENQNLSFLFNQNNSITTMRSHRHKPIICAINGFCIGFGLEIALLCDLRVMEDTAVMGFYNRKFGVPLCDGGTVRLAKMIGYSRALDIITTGRKVFAKEAFEIGLINRIVATGTSLGQAVNLAFSIAKFSQNSLLHDRSSLYTSAFEGKDFVEITQQETMLSDKVLEELKVGVCKIRNSETKGVKIDSFNIKEKTVPDWEKEEIKKEIEYARSKHKLLKTDSSL